jgi:hypothetical protein
MIVSQTKSLNKPLSFAPWLQPGFRAGRRGPSRCNGFPAGLSGTGYQLVPLVNLPNGMGSATEGSERLLTFQRPRRSVRQVAGRDRLGACATPRRLNRSLPAMS